MTRWFYAIGSLLIIAAAIGTIVLYPQLPAVVATHWDISRTVTARGGLCS
jgi:uncharacterized membrane protein